MTKRRLYEEGEIGWERIIGQDLQAVDGASMALKEESGAEIGLCGGGSQATESA